MIWVWDKIRQTERETETGRQRDGERQRERERERDKESLEIRVIGLVINNGQQTIWSMWLMGFNKSQFCILYSQINWWWCRWAWICIHFFVFWRFFCFYWAGYTDDGRDGKVSRPPLKKIFNVPFSLCLSVSPYVVASFYFNGNHSFTPNQLLKLSNSNFVTPTL